MMAFKAHTIATLSAVALAAGLAATTLSGQTTTPNTVDAHVAAAKAAAGTEHTSVFNGLCAAPAQTPAPTQAPARGRGTVPQQGPPPRAQWHAEPAKVFDNLLFVGQTEYTAWAVTTSDGIIVIDPLFEYSVEDEIVEGLKKLGHDPRTIKYVLVSHGHRDHVGGARFLQERFSARVVMSEADWDLVDRTGGSWPKPKRDVVATDGQRLTLGDTTLTLTLTPGHTPGTISTIVPLKDQGRAHVAALWGGTGFNFTITPDKPRKYWFEQYINSAQRFRDVVAKAGADVLIANHPNQDNAKAKLAALAARKPGDRHPFVVGNDSVTRYLTMVGECARAGQLRLQ
jgi:metallo-beta-lactamase class B